MRQGKGKERLHDQNDKFTDVFTPIESAGKLRLERTKFVIGAHRWGYAKRDYQFGEDHLGHRIRSGCAGI